MVTMAAEAEQELSGSDAIPHAALRLCATFRGIKKSTRLRHRLRDQRNDQRRQWPILTIPLIPSRR